jgi:hypothetical protein
MHGGTGCQSIGDNGDYDGTCTGLTASLGLDGYPVTSSAGVYVFAQSFGYSTWNGGGIIQTKSGRAEYYTQPMLALSTSFGLDYKGAKWRSCMNADVNARFNSSAYLSDVSNATTDPNGRYSGSEPTYLGSSETNLEHLAVGCTITHYSGGWFDSSASSYAAVFVSALNTHPWPGGLQ